MVKYNNYRSTKLIKPDIKPAPAIKPLFNIGALLDIPTRYRDWETDRKSTRLNSSHSAKSRMPSSA